MIGKQIDAFSGGIFSFNIVTGEEAGGRWERRGEAVPVRSLGLELVPSWGRGRAGGVLGRGGWTWVPESLQGGGSGKSKASTSDGAQGWPCGDLAAPARPEEFLLAARLLPDV